MTLVEPDISFFRRQKKQNVSTQLVKLINVHCANRKDPSSVTLARQDSS